MTNRKRNGLDSEILVKEAMYGENSTDVELIGNHNMSAEVLAKSVLDMETLRNEMKAIQKPDRYEHTLGVAYTAACLAGVYRVDAAKALRAGLLHDCAKCMEDAQLLSQCEQLDLNISESERRQPFLLHAKLGAWLAKEKYGETDIDILHAILYHTTGRPKMSMLEKIVFVADYIEPGRNRAPFLHEIRILAFSDIDKALVKILEDTLEYLNKKGAEIAPETKITLDYYKNYERDEEDYDGVQRNGEACSCSFRG